MGKEGEKTRIKEKEAECGNGARRMEMGREEAKTNQKDSCTKPKGFLSSLGTKMFQSQNISLVEFQGFRGKSQLKRGSQTSLYIYKIHLYIYNI